MRMQSHPDPSEAGYREGGGPLGGSELDEFATNERVVSQFLFSDSYAVCLSVSPVYLREK